MKATKVFTWMILSIMMVFGTVFALPISVEDLRIQEDNGDYLLLVSLSNANTASGVTDDLQFTIEELGTTKNVGSVRVDSNGTEVFSYNLREVTDSFSSLKKGETYQVTVESSTNSMTEAFLFGSEQDTDGLGLILEEVEVNNEELNDLDTLQVLNGETLEVKMRLSALEDFDDARIMVFIEGYEHSPLVDSTDIFSVVEGKTYTKSLNINLPSDMDNSEDYKLRIVGANELSGITYKEFSLYVDTQRHRVDVLDLIMTPSSGVEAGQNIIANVRMKNRGQKSQDSVRVNVAIPELGISESSYVSNLNSDEVATSDDMLLFVPENAAAGTYQVETTLSYDDGYTETVEVYTLNVLSPRLVADENLLVSFRNNVDLTSGTSNSFEVVIGNPNENSKPISLTSIENAWADVEVSPTLAMVKGGDSETFTVTVTPKSGSAGEKEVALVVKEGASTVNEFSVNTFVTGTEDVNWLNVVLVVLLILAIIVLLALVITIAKRKNDSNEDESSSNEEYY